MRNLSLTLRCQMCRVFFVFLYLSFWTYSIGYLFTIHTLDPYSKFELIIYMKLNSILSCTSVSVAKFIYATFLSSVAKTPLSMHCQMFAKRLQKWLTMDKIGLPTAFLHSGQEEGVCKTSYRKEYFFYAIIRVERFM